MAKYEWVTSVSGTWTDASDWSHGKVPGHAAKVTIDAGLNSGPQYTVAIDSAVTVYSLTLDSSGATLEIGGQTAGSLTATNMTIDAGVLQVGGLAAGSVDVGRMIVSGGVLAIGTGTAAGTLTVGDLSCKGSLEMGDGTLSGTVTYVPFGFYYGDYDASGATLANVTWHGSFAPELEGIDNSQFLDIVGGLTLTGGSGTGPGTVTLQNGASLEFLGNQTLDNATITLGGTYISSGATCTILSAGSGSSAASLTLGPNLELISNGASLLETNGAVTNDGTIKVTTGQNGVVPGPLVIEGAGVFTNAGFIDILGRMTENVGEFVNTGTIDVKGGTLTLTESATSNWTNSGVIDAAGGSVFFAGTVTTAQLGSFEVSNGGSLGLVGTLLNAGGTLTLGPGGLPSLTVGRGGVIDGGTVQGVNLVTLDGGTLQGVTWLGNLDLTGVLQSAVIGDGITFVPPGGSTTTTIEVSGQSAALSFATSQTLSDVDLILNGTASEGSTDASLGIGEGGTGVTTLTLAGNTSLQLSENAMISGDTLVNDGVIEGPAGGQTTFTLQSFVNAGTMDFTQAKMGDSQVFETYIEAVNFANSGTIDVTNHNILSFAPEGVEGPASETWSSTGVIMVSDATLRLGGTLSTASLETIQTGSGASVVMEGTLENAGQVLSVGGGSELGTLTLSGMVLGGTLAAVAGAVNFSGGTLVGVTSETGIDLNSAGAVITIEDGLTLAPGATLSLTGSDSSLHFLNSQTLANGVIDLGGAAGSAELLVTAMSVAATLTLAATSALLQTGLYSEVVGNTNTVLGKTLVNDGLIQASVQAGSLSINHIDIVNAGTFEVSNGEMALMSSGTLTNTGMLSVDGAATTLTLGAFNVPIGFDNSGIVQISGGLLNVGAPEFNQQQGDSWSNTGTIEIAGGTLGLNMDVTTAALGSITVSNGGEIMLGGQIDNAGSVLTLGAGSTLGSIALYGGTIVGGTIVDNGGGLGGNYGTLSGVTYDGVLDLSAAGGTLSIANGITMHGTSGVGTSSIQLSGAGSTLNFLESTNDTLNNTSLVFGPSGTISSYLGVVLGNQLTIEQAGNATFAGYDIINDTSIDGSIAGGSLTIAASTMTNDGTVALSNGQSADFTGLNFDSAGLISIGSASGLTLNPTNYVQFGGEGSFFSNSGTVQIGGGMLVEPAPVGASGPGPVLSNASGADITGFGTIDAAFTNAGTIEANGGMLMLQQLVTGAGVLQADAGATLLIGDGAAAGQTANFAGANATIGLAPMSFLGEIGGFAVSDQIDLFQTQASSARFAGSSIVVTLSNSTTLVLDTTSALTGSITVTAGADGDSLLTYAADAAKADPPQAPGWAAASASAAAPEPWQNGPSVYGGYGVSDDAHMYWQHLVGAQIFLPH